MVGPVAVVLLDCSCHHHHHHHHHHYYYYHSYCYTFSMNDALMSISKAVFTAVAVELALLHSVHNFQTQFAIQTTAHFSTWCQSIWDWLGPVAFPDVKIWVSGCKVVLNCICRCRGGPFHPTMVFQSFPESCHILGLALRVEEILLDSLNLLMTLWIANIEIIKFLTAVEWQTSL